MLNSPPTDARWFRWLLWVALSGAAHGGGAAPYGHLGGGARWVPEAVGQRALHSNAADLEGLAWGGGAIKREREREREREGERRVKELEEISHGMGRLLEDGLC